MKRLRTMPRTFKFSFPLPSRKPQNADVNANKNDTYSKDIDDYPRCGPGPKAEQVLGTSDPSPLTPSDKSSFWSRKPRKYSSYMSVTISDADGETPLSRGSATRRDHDDGMRYGVRPDLVRNKASSPLLGELDQPQGCFPIGTSRLRPHNLQSPSTVQSSYSVRREPPSPLPRGTLSSPQVFATPRSRPTSPARQRCGSGSLHRFRASQYDRDAYPFPRTKPSNLDLSGFPPPSQIVSPSIRSPHLYSKALPQEPTLPNKYGSTLGRGKWFGRERSKKDIKVGWAASSADVHISEQPGPRFGAPNPSRALLTPVDWMHCIDEVKNANEPSHEELVGYPLSEDPISSLISGRNDVFQRRKHSVDEHSSPEYSKSRSNTLESTKSRGAKSLSTTASAASECPSYINSQSVFIVDRLNQSVLSLSSSSEDEGEALSTAKPQLYRHRIRESVDRTDRGDQPFVSNAQSVISTRPRPVLHSKAPRKTRSRSNSSEVVPPVPSIPTRPLPTPRVSSIRWQERMNSQNAMKEVESLSSTHLKNIVPHDRVAVHSRSNPQQRKPSWVGKMIAVTPEEEMVLENMRRKRASIRNELPSEARSTASLVDGSAQIAHRPKTSGDERKLSEINLNGYHVAMPDHDLGKTLKSPRSASADSLPRNEAFPFPPMPSHSEDTPSLSSTSNKQSPDSTSNPMDHIPSPTARRSPSTPPLGYSPRVSSQRTKASPSRIPSFTSMGTHEQEQTMNSGGVVVVLDGAEPKAQQLNGEGAITGWALDQCPW